jgi:hypothetical protein
MADFQDINVWDRPIDEEPSEFKVLPAGDYPFTVIKFSRETTGEKAKNPGEPILVISLEVDGGANGKATVFHRILWTEKLKWKQSEFFVGIGQRAHGDKGFVPNWNRIVGSTGYVRLKTRMYEGKMQNEVDIIIDPEKAPLPDDVASYSVSQATYVPNTSGYSGGRF